MINKISFVFLLILKNFIYFSDGLKGIAIAGGVIVGIASILGVGIAMAKKG